MRESNADKYYTHYVQYKRYDNVWSSPALFGFRLRLRAVYIRIHIDIYTIGGWNVPHMKQLFVVCIYIYTIVCAAIIYMCYQINDEWNTNTRLCVCLCGMFNRRRNYIWYRYIRILYICFHLAY